MLTSWKHNKMLLLRRMISIRLTIKDNVSVRSVTIRSNHKRSISNDTLNVIIGDDELRQPRVQIIVLPLKTLRKSVNTDGLNKTPVLNQEFILFLRDFHMKNSRRPLKKRRQNELFIMFPFFESVTKVEKRVSNTPPTMFNGLPMADTWMF